MSLHLAADIPHCERPWVLHWTLFEPFLAWAASQDSPTHRKVVADLESMFQQSSLAYHVFICYQSTRRITLHSGSQPGFLLPTFQATGPREQTDGGGAGDDFPQYDWVAIWAAPDYDDSVGALCKEHARPDERDCHHTWAKQTVIDSRADQRRYQRNRRGQNNRKRYCWERRSKKCRLDSQSIQTDAISDLL